MRPLIYYSRKLFANFTDDPNFESYLQTGLGSTKRLLFLKSIFLYKAFLSLCFLWEHDKITVPLNYIFYNTVWLDGLPSIVNRTLLLLSVHGFCLIYFLSKDQISRTSVQSLLANGTVNEMPFFLFPYNNKGKTYQRRAHAKLRKFCTVLRIPIRMCFSQLSMLNQMQILTLKNKRYFIFRSALICM